MAMKLKAQHVFDATLTVDRIIGSNRPMPQKGKYRLARLYAKLLPEFTTLNERRDAMITAYGHHEMVDVMDTRTNTASHEPSPQFSVPADKLSEWAAAWKEIGDQEIEVDVEPVPLVYLELSDCADGSITATELVTLGDLVKE